MGLIIPIERIRKKKEGKKTGVYIPNMKMPENCWECRFAVDGWCYAYGKPNIDALANDGLTNFCPLVPVPPHGRLIDADEFLKRAIGTKCFRGDYALMLEELVGESTTIIPAEEDTDFYTKGHLHLGYAEEGE